MKTKHLLFAAALPLAFAACQNEEFDGANSPELSKDQRPLVEVKLAFQKEGADTRVSYDGGVGYGWESTDKIGAFLMDEIASTSRPFGATAEDWAKETWLEHYKLVNYIHTDYPFSWDATKKEWGAPSKLQEGNYFFASPYETYEGERQMIHYLDRQKQTGGTKADMNKAVAANQYFVGYGQIKAGTDNKEALKENVFLSPVLAPIKVTLRNIGTQAKHVEKIVVYSAGTGAAVAKSIATALTVDPTNAAYGGTDSDGKIKTGNAYNLSSSANNKPTWIADDNNFNYANALAATKAELKEDIYSQNSTDFVYNVASGATDFSRADAMRQTVKPSYSQTSPKNIDDIPAIERQAILTFTTPVEIKEKTGEIYFAVMVNTLPDVDKNHLFMDIITTEGRITGIDLTEKKESENETSLAPNTVLLNKGIVSLKPGVVNELIMQFDNNSVVKIQEMDVQDEDQLLAFIKWNGENNRVNTATLIKDVKFTKAMYDELKKAGYVGKLAVTGEGKLLVDDNVPTEVLNVFEKTTDATVVMNGTRTMTKAIADKFKADSSVNLTIENRGTMSIAEEVVAYNRLNNYGTIKVTKDGKLQGQAGGKKVYNYGVIENAGEIANVENEVDGEFKGLIKTSGIRNHVQSNVAGATIQLTKIDDLLQLVNKNAGVIFFETEEGVAVSQLAEVKGKRTIGVNKLTVKGGTITFDNCDNATVTDLTINGTVKAVGVDDKNKPAYHKFTKVTKASINGKVSLTNAGIENTNAKITVEAGAALTLDGTVNLTDNITFIKGATVSVVESGVVTVKESTWNGNNISNFGTFQYTGTKPTGYTVIEGKGLTPKGTAPKPADPVNVKIVATSTGAEGEYTLDELYAATKATQGAITIGEITIEGTINAGVDSNTDKPGVTPATKFKNGDLLKELAAGKKVTLSGTTPSITGLTNALGLSFGELVVGADATIGGTEKMVVLTVGKITLDAKLTVDKAYIQLNEAGIEHNNTENISGTGTLAGTVVDSTKTLKYDQTNKEWVKLN